MNADDTIDLVTTYLEMLAPPSAPPPPRPAVRHALMRAENPTVAFYRFLYDTVGADWTWYERRAMDDAALAAIIGDTAVEIYVLYVGGVPAGYAELDVRDPTEVELAYFGLMPEFRRRGLGRWLLRWIIDQAWVDGPARLWVHTCNLDDPRALGMYQRAGFRAYRQEREAIPDPRGQGLFDRS